MSTKTQESGIREILKTIGNLMCKVASMEVKIDEQSKLISKLSSANSVCEKCKSLASVSPLPPPADLALDTALQRPVRAARLNAVAAMEISSNMTKRKQSAARAETPNATGNVNKSRASPAMISTKIKSKSSTMTAETSLTPNNLTASTPTIDESSGKLNIQTDELSNVNGQNEGFVVVSRKRRTKPTKSPSVIVGTGTGVHELKAVERLRSIQAWYFEPTTTPEQVTTFLKKVVNSDFRVEKRVIRTDRHASFAITMPESVYELVTSPDVWPPGVRFSEWFPRRPRVARGAEGEQQA